MQFFYAKDFYILMQDFLIYSTWYYKVCPIRIYSHTHLTPGLGDSDLEGNYYDSMQSPVSAIIDLGFGAGGDGKKRGEMRWKNTLQNYVHWCSSYTTIVEQLSQWTISNSDLSE